MLLNIILFVVVILILVMVHELGHFLMAKLSKMRVEEFAFGFPPKIFAKKYGETTYSLNALPLGGYVKITGESFDEEEREKLKLDERAFQNRPRILQFLVLVSGVVMNLILALVIFTYINSIPHVIDSSSSKYGHLIDEPRVFVTSVMQGSPALTAGLYEGAEIVSMSTSRTKAELTSSESVVEFVRTHSEEIMTIVYKNKLGGVSTSSVSAVYGLIPDRKSVGMSITYGEYMSLGFVESFRFAISDTYDYTVGTVQGLSQVAVKLVSGGDAMSDLSGPVGIANLVGTASKTGIENVLFMIAILSINLAVFNILPFPALDGGRILFVIYEAITRRAINYKIQYYANAVGFLLLIGLMLVTTYFDILKIL